jgi:uncharacterized membrane protein YeaQ/YmgE (transglycosylase-associated protein family)
MAALGFTRALGHIEASAYLVHHVAQDMLDGVTRIGRLLSFAAGAAGSALGGLLTQQYGTAHAVTCLLSVTLILAMLSHDT